MSNARKPAGAAKDTVSPETAEFLLGLINGLTLTVNAPDFEEAVTKVMKARVELGAIIATG